MIHLLWILPMLWVLGFFFTMFVIREPYRHWDRKDKRDVVNMAARMWPVFLYYIIREKL